MQRMQKRKNKRRKANYVLLIVSDSPVEKIKKYKFSRKTTKFLKALFIMVMLVFVAYIGFTSYHNTIVMSRETKLKQEFELLNEQYAALEQENEQLLEKVSILSKTVNEKVNAEKEQEEKNMPSGFPLSGSANLEEQEEILELGEEEVRRPLIYFEAEQGVGAVAAGAGTISYVAEDNKYGYQVYVDHGNGYTTIYRSGTEPKVKEGDEVTRGTLLYELKENDDNEYTDVMVYQVMKDGNYIKPTDVLKING